MQETTEVVALEDALRRSERMAEIGTLISGVAHEVRNPLFAISAGIETLAHEPHLPATATPVVQLLREPVARLGALMQDLLEYARPSVRERQPAPLEQAAAAAIRECEPLARAQDVRLLSRWPEGLAPVSMDLDRMIQALQNVVQNAIQHSPRGGTVELELEGGPSEGGTWLVCAIRDTGPGFPEEVLHRAFEPLFTRRPGGTGLGLCIARNVVEEHGGRIGIRNLAAGGACVTIRLPAAETTAGPTPEAG
jgi:signal transduction histidine kinase